MLEFLKDKYRKLKDVFLFYLNSTRAEYRPEKDDYTTKSQRANFERCIDFLANMVEKYAPKIETVTTEDLLGREVSSKDINGYFDTKKFKRKRK